MHVRPIRTLEDLAPLAGAINALSGDVPFRRYEWLASWWRHFGPGICRSSGGRAHNPRGGLLTLAVHDSDGVLIGVAPWYVSRSLADGRAIRFLGSGQVCSDYLTLLAQPGRETNVAGAVADWLSARTDLWDLIELEGVDATDVAVPELGLRLQAAGHRLHQIDGPNCWRVPLPATWDAFLAMLAGSKRQRAKRIKRRLFDTGRATIRVIDRPDQWETGIEIFHQLHQKRRRSVGDKGCFATPEFGRFLHEAGRDLLEAGHAVMLVLDIDGKPAAAEYNLLGGGVVYFYQAGIDPDQLAEQPGHVLTAARMERVIQRGYQAVDFLRGDEPYKAHWGAEPRALMSLRIVRRQPAAQLRHQMWQLNRDARRLARQGLTAAGQWRRQVRSLYDDVVARARKSEAQPNASAGPEVKQE